MGVIRLRLNADPAVITTSPCLHRLLVSPNFHAYREKTQDLNLLRTFIRWKHFNILPSPP